mmetsp:Transcript_5670/g.8322  ORF Transcript_5670/g.8322 Transcript_5670/m.8322 type:complete len:106 (-) Transcript_5670:1915-2232(-)
MKQGVGCHSALARNRQTLALSGTTLTRSCPALLDAHQMSAALLQAHHQCKLWGGLGLMSTTLFVTRRWNMPDDGDVSVANTRHLYMPQIVTKQTNFCVVGHSSIA